MAKGGRRAHSGRKPRPTEVKLVTGAFRADRDADRPLIEGKWPAAPERLSERERGIWAQLEQFCSPWVVGSDFLAVHGVVSLTDRILRNQDAQRETETAGHPLTFTHVIKHAVDGQGQPTELEIVTPEENPLITQEVKLWRELRAYIGIMGLSPVDRARVHKNAEPAKANPLDRFIKRA